MPVQGFQPETALVPGISSSSISSFVVGGI